MLRYAEVEEDSKQHMLQHLTVLDLQASDAVLLQFVFPASCLFKGNLTEEACGMRYATAAASQLRQ